MTDTAVLDGGAIAPAEPTGAPINEVPTGAPNPLGTQTPVAEKPEVVEKPADTPAKNAGEAIRKANEAIKAKEAAEAKQKAEQPTEQPKQDAPKVEAKTEAKPEQPRENGRFASQQPQQAEQPKPVADPSSPNRAPPARFDDAAKAEWESAPESVKGAVHRAIRELEQGHQKYKADSERYEGIRQFDDIARQNGRELKDSLAKVVEIEQALARNPIAGLDAVLREVGPRKADGSPYTMLDIAAHVMNQTPDQRASQQNSTIARLEGEISRLNQQLSSLAPVVQTVQTEANERALTEWAADKPHFKALRAEVTEYVRQGVSPDDAYQRAVQDFQEKARSFGLSSQSAAHTGTDPAVAHTQAPQPKPLKPEGQKSITGSPAVGVDTDASRKTDPAPSIREALKRATARAG